MTQQLNNVAAQWSLSGKVVFITGSSRGIGRAMALECAESGADVVVTSRVNGDLARETAEEIIASGGRALALDLDVTNSSSIRKAFADTMNAWGRIDVLINNAGIIQQKDFLDISEQDWDQVMDVNLKGAFLCSQLILPLMRTQGHGRIINLASSGGQLGGTLAVHYAASKAGIISLTRSLARIGAPDGILANCIAPGLIDTDMTQQEIHSPSGTQKIRQIPLQRVGTPAEVAWAAVFLASDGAAYLTGQTININGGLYLG